MKHEADRNVSDSERPEVETVDDAMALIRRWIAQGLVPVMAGTSWVRYGFSPSPLKTVIFYLDERGTQGSFRPQSVYRVLGWLTPEELIRAKGGHATGVGFGVFAPERRAPSLVEAADQALKLLDRLGVKSFVRDDLEAAIAAEVRR